MAKKPARKTPRLRKKTAPRALRPKAKAREPDQVVVHRFPKRSEVEVAPRSVGRAFPIELDPKRIDETLGKIRNELSHWAKKGRYTKVRFKFRGKQLLPDLPLAAVIAAEGLTFYWGGILRALLVNFGARSLFNVELVNDSEKRIQRGKEELLSGDVDKALVSFREAIDMDRDNPRAHLNVGVALKIKGDYPGARSALEKARSLDPDGPVGVEAERMIASLPGPGPTALATVPPAPPPRPL
jgi:tetratricopeptide (TPR) repeat protein